eukprot:6581715-Prymnesium_polylepis.1
MVGPRGEAPRGDARHPAKHPLLVGRAVVPAVAFNVDRAVVAHLEVFAGAAAAREARVDLDPILRDARARRDELAADDRRVPIVALLDVGPLGAAQEPRRPVLRRVAAQVEPVVLILGVSLAVPKRLNDINLRQEMVCGGVRDSRARSAHACAVTPESWSCGSPHMLPGWARRRMKSGSRPRSSHTRRGRKGRTPRKRRRSSRSQRRATGSPRFAIGRTSPRARRPRT